MTFTGRHRRDGFTLVEVMLVVVLIGILVALRGSVVGSQATTGAKLGGVKQDAASLGTYFDGFTTLRGQVIPTTLTGYAQGRTGYPTASPNSVWALRSVTANGKGAILWVAYAADTTKRCTVGVGSSAGGTPLTCAF